MTRGRLAYKKKLSGPARRGVRNGPSFHPPSSAIGLPKGGNELRTATFSACGVSTLTVEEVAKHSLMCTDLLIRFGSSSVTLLQL